MRVYAKQGALDRGDELRNMRTKEKVLGMFGMKGLSDNPPFQVPNRALCPPPLAQPWFVDSELSTEDVQSLSLHLAYI